VELLKLHEEMEEMVGEGNDFEANAERHKRRLTENRKNKERVKPRRDNYLRMVEMKGRIDLLEKRRRHLEYEARIAHLHEAEEEAKTVDHAFKEATKRVNPLEGKIEMAKAARKEIEKGLEKTVSGGWGVVWQRMRQFRF
jgi:chromosome segregation ATPase